MKLLFSLFNRAEYRGLAPFLQTRTGLVPSHRQIHTPPADPRWQILNRWGIRRGSSANVVADDRTVAECRTSSGRPFRVSVGAAAPPAISFISVHPSGDGGEDEESADKNCFAIAAHGDSVLLERSKVPRPSMERHYRSYEPWSDYFVYKAAAAGESPSLSLLPTCLIPVIRRDYQGYIHGRNPTAREFDQSDTGILLRRGEDDLLVAQLKVANDAPFDTAELCVLRHGRRREWELKEAVPIVHHRSGDEHDLGMWQDTNAAVPVGDRFLCWVNFDCSTFLLWDTAAAAAAEQLRYVRLPVKAVPPEDDEDYEDYYDGQKPWIYYRSIAAAGPSAVRFVSVDNRCCCGAHVIRSSCEHSSSAFMVTVWSLALTTGGEPMTWVKECVLDCEEVWSLVAAKGLPRVDLTTPVLSSENPDVVCFIACKGGVIMVGSDRREEEGDIICNPLPGTSTRMCELRQPFASKTSRPLNAG